MATKSLYSVSSVEADIAYLEENLKASIYASRGRAGETKETKKIKKQIAEKKAFLATISLSASSSVQVPNVSKAAAAEESAPVASKAAVAEESAPVASKAAVAEESAPVASKAAAAEKKFNFKQFLAFIKMPKSSQEMFCKLYPDIGEMFIFIFAGASEEESFPDKFAKLPRDAQKHATTFWLEHQKVVAFNSVCLFLPDVAAALEIEAIEMAEDPNKSKNHTGTNLTNKDFDLCAAESKGPNVKKQNSTSYAGVSATHDPNDPKFRSPVFSGNPNPQNPLKKNELFVSAAPDQSETKPGQSCIFINENKYSVCNVSLDDRLTIIEKLVKTNQDKFGEDAFVGLRGETVTIYRSKIANIVTIMCILFGK